MRYGRHTLIAATTLPASGVYAATTTYGPVGGTVNGATFYITYTAGGAGGAAAFKVLVGNGTDMGRVLAPDGTYDPIQGPTLTSALDVDTFAISVDLLGGETHIGIAGAETGDTASPGDILVTVTLR